MIKSVNLTNKGKMTHPRRKNFLFHALGLVFQDPLFVILALALTLNLLLFYYLLFDRVSTLEVFFASNANLYNWLSIVLTFLISLFFGVAASLLLYQWRQQKKVEYGQGGNSLIASFLGALATGCPVCGAFLASALGIAGGLAAFPFQGLEIKAISVGLLSFAIGSSARSISNVAAGTCEPEMDENLFRVGQGRIVLQVNRKTIRSLVPAGAGLFLLGLVILLPAISDELGLRVSFQPNSLVSLSAVPSSPLNSSSSDLIEQINPSGGYQINAVYNKIGPQLLAAGAIDLEKMEALYQNAGQSLTPDQIKILTEGSDEKIKITSENSYFLLNLLWALGLTNKNPILEEGPMIDYGKEQLGYFASTGGWTLGTKPATELYSSSLIIPLNEREQEILEEFAYNSYRPCCSNPTAFPDCNHGMAALALGEIMAGQGAALEEIFEAFKYFNSFWFAQTYLDLAKYFEVKEGKNWATVDARLVAGKDYSTPQGWSRVRDWLSSNNLIERVPSGGGGCGV